MYPQPQPYPTAYPQPVPPMPAPPAWPQPAPQQYAPPAPPMPQPPAYAPPAAPAAPMGGQAVDDFHNPTPAAANVARPRLMDIGEGRLVLFRPTRIERDLPVPNAKEAAAGKKQDRITTDVVVLDGQPFAYGGKPEKNIPHTHVGQIGEVFTGVWNSNKVMVAQLERSVDPSGRLMVLGRLIKVQGADLTNNPSWRLADPTEADRQIAREWKARYDAGQIPAAQAMAAPAPQPAPQYAPIPQQQPQYPPQPVAPQYTQPQYAPPPAAPVSAPQAIPCPPGIDPAWFAQQPAEAQAYYANQAAAAAAPQPGQPAQWS